MSVGRFDDHNYTLISDKLSGSFDTHTIFLYGSRADGTSNETSDLDVAGFAERQERNRDCFWVNDLEIDVFIYDEKLLRQPTAELLRLRGAKVILDRKCLAQTFLEKIEKIFEQGPPLVDERTRAVNRNWAWKVVRRMRRDDVEARYRRAWLLYELLEYYFSFRRMWYEGPKRAFSWLKENDLPTYVSFENALRENATVADIEMLVELVIGPPQ
jgi:hypothetical protein